MLGNPHDAEEVAQDALVRAYRALAGYPADADPRASSPAVAGDDRRQPVPQPHPAACPADDAARAAGRRWASSPRPRRADEPASIADRAADREQLAALLATLPDRYRIPVVLRHVDDLSYAELSEVLGRPEGTLKAQVSRGLAMLRAAAAGTELEELTA